MKKARTLLAIWLALILTLTLFPTALADGGNDPGAPTQTLEISFSSDPAAKGMPSSLKNIEKNATVSLNTVEPTLSGYTFEGWKVKSGKDGDSKVYKIGESFTIGESNVELVAVWKERTDLLTISFSSDDPAAKGMPSSLKNIEKNATVSLNTVEPTLSGYTFEGWKVKSGKDGDSKVYKIGESFTIGESNVELVAVWKERTDLLTISFSSDDPAAKGMPSSLKNIEKNATVSLNTVEPTLSGYTFEGWKVKSGKDGDSKVYKIGDSFTIGETNVELVAVWKQVASKITVQFAKENNSGRVPWLPEPEKVPADQKYQLPTKEPSRTDGSYEFGRWRLNFNGQTYTYSAGAIIDWASIGVKGGDTVTFIADFDHHTYPDRGDDDDRPSKPSYDEYRIRATCSDGGWVSPAGSTYVREGRNLTVTFAPYKGYAIDGVYIDGVLDNRYDGSYTFRDVDENHTIYVRYVRDSGSSGGSGGGSHWDDDTSPKTGDASAPLSMGLGVGSLALIAFLVARKMRRA